MSLLESLAIAQQELSRALPNPQLAHPLHIDVEQLVRTQVQTAQVLAAVRQACTALGEHVQPKNIPALKSWTKELPAKSPAARVPDAARRRRFAAIPPTVEGLEAVIEWTAKQVEGLEVVRPSEGTVTISRKGGSVVLDIEPATAAVRFRYGDGGEEAMWVADAIKANLQPASLGPNLEALARFDQCGAEGKNVWHDFAALRNALESIFGAKQDLQAGLLLNDTVAPWLSLAYDAPAELLLSDEWQTAAASGLNATSLRGLTNQLSRLIIEPSPVGATMAFRATLQPPLVFSQATGRALAAAVGLPPATTPELPGIASLALQEHHLESLLAPALMLDQSVRFIYPASGTSRAQKYTVSQPSGLRGFVLEYMDFDTAPQLKEALQIIQRQARLNDLFTSCFGLRTQVRTTPDELFKPAMAATNAPKLSGLLDGSWRSSECPVDVALGQDRVHVSLPSKEGVEVKLEIDSSGTVSSTSGGPLDVDLARRVLAVSRSIALALRKLHLDA